jgi:ABC-type transport system involved in multi-copper enzyme maturation permease subunit
MPLFENPILTKELRTRMRGARAYWILLAYVGLPSLVVLLTYISYTAYDRYGYSSQTAFQLGKVFYSTVFTIQAILVGLITPALTAGGISLEKEQRTYDLLSLTKLPRRAIIQGKLLSATLFVALLLTSSLPLASLCFLLGGVAPSQVNASYVILLSCAFLYGAVGIASSSVAKTTTNATSLAYGAILLLFFCTLPMAVMGMSRSFGVGSPGIGLTAVNPIGAVTSGNLGEIYFGFTMPAWLPAILLNSLLGLVLTVNAIHRLEYPRTDRTPLLRLLCVLLTGALAFFFYGFLEPRAPGGGIANGPASMLTVSILTLCGTIMAASIFATGEILTASGNLLRLIFDPRRLRIGDDASGLLYSGLLLLICGVVLYAGAGTFPRSPILKLMVLCFALLWVLGTMGIWLSQIARNRWAAMAATLAFASVLCIAPMLSQIRMNGQPKQPSVFDNLLYMSPFPAAVELSGENMKDFRSAKLIFGKTPFLPITSIYFAGLGIVFLGLAERSRRKQ